MLCGFVICFKTRFQIAKKTNHPTQSSQWLSVVSLTYLSKIFCSLQQKGTTFWVWVRITFGQQLFIKLSSRQYNKNRLYVDSISFLDSLPYKYLLFTVSILEESISRSPQFRNGLRNCKIIMQGPPWNAPFVFFGYCHEKIFKNSHLTFKRILFRAFLHVLSTRRSKLCFRLMRL